MSAEEIANAFVNHFYTALDNNPADLLPLYQAQSQLTFEGNKFEGPQAIVGKHAQNRVLHDIGNLTKDVQLSVNSSSMLIYVTGRLKIGGPDANPLLFSHLFQLVALAPGQYYVHNEIFRLLYA